ncbi:MAG: ATP-binding protein [Gemmatimonadaceae bacterium]
MTKITHSVDGHSKDLWRLAPRGLAPLALIVLALLGSVAIPARQTWFITELLHHTNEVLRPARVVESALRSGLAEEMAALQGYALTADTTLLGRYQITAAEDDRRLANLDALAVGLTASSSRHIATVGRQIADWRERAKDMVGRRESPAAFAAAIAAAQLHYDAALSAIDDLSDDLAAETALRDDRVRTLEHSSLVWNAALVFAALAVLSGVALLMVRERRLAAVLRRRIDEESALRQLARTLSGAVTLDEAMQATVAGALATASTSGAYLEWVVAEEQQIDVVVGFSHQVVSLRTRVSNVGSLTGTITTDGNADGLLTLDAIGPRLPVHIGESCDQCFGLVAPLVSSEGTFGALVLIRSAGATAFGADERRQIQLIGGLASATLRRMDGMATERRALDDARRRARQEVALREAAEALAGAFTMDAVTERIAHAALDAMEGQGAFVEAIVAPSDGSKPFVVVRAAAGVRIPPPGSVVPFAGSLTQQVMNLSAPMLIPDLKIPGNAGAVGAFRESGGAAIVIPLGTSADPVGALFVLSAAHGHFRADDVTRAAIFGHLAALAYEKVRILDDAYEGRRKLERVLQSRSRLMRGFSHDVKNPIGAADGYAELLGDGIYGELSEAQRETVGRIRRCIKSGLALIDDLHELARAETGKIAISFEPVDLASLVRAAGEEYQAAARAGGLSLFVVVEPNLPMVETNGARVGQIVSNLLSNAIKYTERGAVTLRALRRPEGPLGMMGDWVLIEVIDTGVGIPANQHDVIFEEFSRIGQSDKPGAGLGLAISRLLAQALGGHIAVASDLGHGSTFTLWLPVHRPESSVATSVSNMMTGSDVVGERHHRDREVSHIRELPASRTALDQ